VQALQEFEEEGKKAIDSPGSPMNFDISPEDYDLGLSNKTNQLFHYERGRHGRVELIDWFILMGSRPVGEGDERSLIERRSFGDPKLQQLIALLIDWINDELADQRIIVKTIDDDLYDGQILQKLLGKFLD